MDTLWTQTAVDHAGRVGTVEDVEHGLTCSDGPTRNRPG